MADSIEHFDQARNIARVAAGFKGPSMRFQKQPMQVKRTFVDGTPPEVRAKYEATPIKQGTPTDPWSQRR